MRNRQMKPLALLAAMLLCAGLLWGCGGTPVAESEIPFTMSVSCADVWKAPEELGEGLAEILPADGAILPEETFTVSEGTVLMDVFTRICREQKIPMEFSKTPGTGSSYVQSVAGLGEGDCGEYSGWVFTVDGEWTTLTASEYVIQGGETIAWNYYCAGSDRQ